MTDGGPAFPRPYSKRKSALYKPENYTSQAGMTLRQWYAGMALQGMLAKEETAGTFIQFAKDAFDHADAMLKQGST